MVHPDKKFLWDLFLLLDEILGHSYFTQIKKKSVGFLSLPWWNVWIHPDKFLQDFSFPLDEMLRGSWSTQIKKFLWDFSLLLAAASLTDLLQIFPDEFRILYLHLFLSRWDLSISLSTRMQTVMWDPLQPRLLTRNVLFQWFPGEYIGSQHIWAEFRAAQENRQAWLGFFLKCQDFVQLRASLLAAIGHGAPKLMTQINGGSPFLSREFLLFMAFYSL